MKVLVYGCGVIGSYLVNVLCEAGNDVTVISRGRRRKLLEEHGLEVYHMLQKKTTLDHPRISEAPTGEYDAVFCVMQGQQHFTLLEELAGLQTPLVILVGNNPHAAKAEEIFRRHAFPDTALLFGFQPTAGVREEKRTVCIRAGRSGLTVGGLHREPGVKEMGILSQIFAGTGYALTKCDDMEGWLYSHAAVILPIVCLCYRYDCDLRQAKREDIREMLEAEKEAYALLAHKGIRIRPKGDEEYFQNPAKMKILEYAMYIMAKTVIGELAASDHCRNAPQEMYWIDQCFEELRDENMPMPVWERMHAQMPAWNTILETYGKKE